MPMDLAPIFQQVFQTSATPTLLVAHNGTVLAGSDSLQALLGYSAASLQGKSIKSLVSANSPEWQSIVENHQPTSVSVALLSADAKTELVQLQLTPVTIAQESDPVWYVKLNPAPLSDLSHSDLFSGRGQYLEKVLQTITDGFLVMNKQGDVLFCNQSAAQIMRVNSSEDLIGKNIWQRVPELNVLKQYPGFDLVFQQNQPARFKEYFPGYDFWVEISAYPSENNVVVYFKDVNDVVKFKKIQSLEREVLAMNANPYKELPEVLDFYITSLEKMYNGLVMLLWKVENDRLIQWSAKSVPESITAACSKVAIQDDQFVFSRAVSEKRRLVADHIAANVKQDARAQLLQEAGFVALSANPIILSSGDVVGVLEVFYTEQQHNLLEEPGTIERTVNLLHVLLENKLAQENIRLSNQRYDLITKATNDIIWEWDMVKGLLIKANAGFSDFFGTDPGQLSLSFNAWKKLLHPDDFYRVISKRNLALRNHDNPYWEDEFRMVNLSGKYNYFYHKAYIVRNASGKAIRLIGATQNITRRKDDEALMIELNNRLKQRADE